MKRKKKPSLPMNTYGGIISQIVTQTNDSRFYLGQVFSGYYQYDSMDPNGVFGIANPTFPPGNRTLRGIIYLPFPEAQARLNSLPSTMNDGSLTVVGGIVTGFAWSLQQGGFYTGFTGNSFYARLMGRIDPTNGHSLPDIETRGSVLFTLPMRQS